MGRSALIGTIATLCVMAFAGLFVSIPFLFSSPVYAQTPTNSTPSFTDGETANRSVNENTAAYTNIGSPVAATDSDSDDRLVYSIQNARTSPFTIVRSTGQLQVGQPLDYEAKSSYTVKVQVTDSEDADGNFENPATIDDTITVTITVNNVEESGKVSLTWNRPQVGTAITATLTDPDGSISGTTWQWAASSSQSGTYDNLSGNGATSDTYTPQAGDKNKYLRATASYGDGKGSGKTASVVSRAQVKDGSSDNKSPVFRDVTSETGYHCPGNPTPTDQVCRYIPRNTPAGDDVYYPVKATDEDHHEIRYSLGGTDAGLFTIEPFRGDLYTKTAHAFNNKNSYSITITATDPSGGSDSITITLTPSGGGANPVVKGPDHITYPENGTWPVATYLASINGRGGVGNDIGWIVSVEPGGGDGDFFDMDDDGNLTFTQPPDYENPGDVDGDNRYDFSLTAYDTNPRGGRRSGSTFFNVTVVVTDETVEPLEIDGPSAVRYAENGTDAVGTYRLLRTTETVDWVLSGADGNLFSINASGQLAFRSPPDYENPRDVAEENTYRVTITAYAGTQSKTEFVFIRVTDVNEPPEFDEEETATREVAADAEVNDLVGDPITATDPDKNAGLTYRLEATPAPPFQIDEYTSQLSVSGAIDSNRASYTFTVFVTDGQDDEGNSDTADDDRITVTVNVTSGVSSNNAPTFPAGTLSFNLAENTTTVVNVGTPVTATDDDTDDTLSYTLEGTDAGFFTIGNTDGQIKTKAAQNYDFETKRTYSVTVKADDSSGGTATKPVTITLTNVEEPGTVTLSTNQPTARAQVTATLTDPDGSISGTSWQWAKSSDGNSNWTNVGTNSSSYTPPDADVNSYLRATASYTDGHGGSKTATATTTQKIGNGTNRAPEFGALTATREVAETTAAGGNVGPVVAASDLDNGDTLTYSLTGADANSFTVDGTGQIKVGASTTLDYESSKKNYTVIVQVHDGKNASGGSDTTIDDTIVVTISVTNVEEAGTLTLSSYQPPARAELTATLTDPDGGVTSESWQWARTTNPTNLNAHPWVNITNATSTSYTPVDGDLGYYLQATVSYTDAEASGKSAKAATTQAVGAGANRAPDFGVGSTAARAVNENSGADVDVGSPVTATDQDTGNTLTYTLEGTDKDSFKIVSDSGQIQTKSGVTYDFETKPTYSVTVKADDQNGGTATKDVTITLTNVEEAGRVTLSTNQPTARAQITATLTDPDIVSGTPTWQWAKSSDGSTGWTNVGTNSASYTPPDADVDNYLRATASYTDGHGGSKTATERTTQKVGDGTNRVPEFGAFTATRNVAENTAANGNVGAVVAATDDDSDSLTYSLTGQDAGLFIIGPGNGQIKVGSSTTLDYEGIRNSYTVIVQVHDNKDPNGGASTAIDDVIVVTINVTNVNEAPEFNSATTTRNVAENSAANTNVGTVVTATDPDAGASLTYTLSGTDAGSFIIDNDGQIKVGASTALDYEAAKNSYEVTVEVRDSLNDAGTADTATDDTIGVTINVTNVNEKPTFTENDPVARSIAENSSAGTNIGLAIGATDPENDTLTYTLGGTNAADFDIVGTSGQLQVKSALDKETKANYTVTISVRDSKNDAGIADTATDDTIVVNITVTEENDPPTVSGSTSINYAESRTNAVATYTANDQDGTTTFSWTLEGDDGGDFDISNAGVLTFKNQPDFESAADDDTDNEYLVTIKASDGNAIGTLDVTVTVTNANDKPTFDETSPTTRSIAENTASNTNIGNPISATDQDTGDTLTYSLGGTDAASFDIDTSSGQLKTKAELDKENKASYQVTVSVRDSKNDAGIADTATDETITVDITVTEENDAPEFDDLTDTREFPENTLAGQDIGSPVAATDDDAGETLTYSLEGTDKDSFTIVPGTGQIQTKSGLTYNHEGKDTYLVIVKVVDSKGGTDIVAVIITVTDLEEAGTVTLSTTHPTARAQFTATLTDPDGGVTGTTWVWAKANTQDGAYTAISGETSATYTPADEDEGKFLKATASYTDRRGAGKTAEAVSANAVGTGTNRAPDFGATTATREFSENTPSGQTIGAPVKATDADNDVLEYTLEGTDAASFQIVGTNGQIQTRTGITYNHEDKDSYSVTVKADDKKGGTDTIDVTINVIDVNEKPSFTATPPVTLNIAENTSANTNIGSAVGATDPDDGDTLFYSLDDASAEIFGIDSSNGPVEDQGRTGQGDQRHLHRNRVGPGQQGYQWQR